MKNKIGHLLIVVVVALSASLVAEPAVAESVTYNFTGTITSVSGTPFGLSPTVDNLTTFDATTVDPATVLFGSTGTEAAAVNNALEDVDGDGDTDMMLFFDTLDTGIQCGDASATLTGETVDGLRFTGADSVNTVGCR